MGWVDPWVGLGPTLHSRVGSRFFFSFWSVELGWIHYGRKYKHLDRIMLVHLKHG